MCSFSLYILNMIMVIKFILLSKHSSSGLGFMIVLRDKHVARIYQLVSG